MQFAILGPLEVHHQTGRVPAGRAPPAGRPGSPAPRCRPGRSRGAAGRRRVGGAASGDGRQDPPEVRVGAAQGAPGPGPAHERRRVRARHRPRRPRRHDASNASSRASSTTPRWRSGAVSCSPTLPASRSWRPSAPASTSCRLVATEARARSRAGPRPPRRGHRAAHRAGRSPPIARAADGDADARPLPGGTPGRGVAGVRRASATPRRRHRASSRPASCATWRPRCCATIRPSSRRTSSPWAAGSWRRAAGGRPGACGATFRWPSRPSSAVTTSSPPASARWQPTAS